MVKSDLECVFCKIAKGEIKNQKNDTRFLDARSAFALQHERIAESNNFFSVFDIQPKVNGHALIIPKKHFVTLLDIPNNLGNEMLEFAKKVADKLMDEGYGDGFNLVMNNLAVAGQVVMHAYLHVLPRREGDGLRAIV